MKLKEPIATLKPSEQRMHELQLKKKKGEKSAPKKSGLKMRLN